MANWYDRYITEQEQPSSSAKASSSSGGNWYDRYLKEDFSGVEGSYEAIPEPTPPENRSWFRDVATTLTPAVQAAGRLVGIGNDTTEVEPLPPTSFDPEKGWSHLPPLDGKYTPEQRRYIEHLHENYSRLANDEAPLIPESDPLAGQPLSSGPIPYRRKVGFGESALRGANTASANILGNVAKLAGPVAGLLGGEEAQDRWFRDVVDPLYTAGEQTQIQRDERQGFSGKLGTASGQMAIELPLMAIPSSRAFAGARAAPSVAAPLSERLVGAAVETAKTSIPVAISHGMDTARNVLAQGGSMEEATLAAVTQSTAETISNVLPTNVAGNVFSRALQGAGSNIVAERFEHAMSNPALPERMRQNMSLEDDAIAAVMGTGMGAVLGERRAREAPLPRPRPSNTGVPAFDAGVNSVIETGTPEVETPTVEDLVDRGQTESRVAPVANAPSVANAPTGDLFTPNNEGVFVGDMFSNEPVVASDIADRQRLREVAEARNEDGTLANPEMNRLPEEATEAEIEYIFSQQERLNQLIKERDERIAFREPTAPTDAEITNLVEEIAETGSGNPVIAQAFQNLGIRDWLEANNVQASPLPETFTPSRVPTVETPEVEQTSMELPPRAPDARDQQDLFPQAPRVPVEAPVSPSTPVSTPTATTTPSKPKASQKPLQAVTQPPKTPPKQAPLETRKAISNQLLDEGLVEGTRQYNTRQSQLLREAGFDVPADNRRAVQTPPLNVGEKVRVKVDGNWTDATIVSESPNKAVYGVQVEGRDKPISLRDQEIERGERTVARERVEVPKTTKDSLSKGLAALEERIKKAGGSLPPKITRKGAKGEDVVDTDKVREAVQNIPEAKRREALIDMVRTADPAPEDVDLPRNALASSPADQNTRVKQNMLSRVKTADKLLDRAVTELKKAGIAPKGIDRLVAALKLHNLGNVGVEIITPQNAKNFGSKVFRYTSENSTAAFYDPATDTIYLKSADFKASGIDPVTQFHEILHAGTFNAIWNVENGKTKDKGSIEAVNDLKKLYNEFKKSTDDFKEFPSDVRFELEYAAKDVHEFASVVGSDIRVQRALVERGLFRKFWDAVKRLLGLPPRVEKDFDAVIDAIENVIRSSVDLTRVSDHVEAQLSGVRLASVEPVASKTNKEDGETAETPLPEKKGWRSVAALRVLEDWLVPGGVLPFGKDSKTLRAVRDVVLSMQGRMTGSSLSGHETEAQISRAMKGDKFTDSLAVRAAMASGDYSKLPPKTAKAAQQAALERDQLRYNLAREILQAKPFETMTGPERAVINKIINNVDYFTDVYLQDVVKNYSKDMLDRGAAGKATPEDMSILEQVRRDLERFVAIPSDLAEAYSSRRIRADEVRRLYKTRIGTPTTGKTAKELVAELELLRDFQDKENYNLTIQKLMEELADPKNTAIGRYFRGSSTIFGDRLGKMEVPESFRKFWGYVNPDENIALATAATIQKQTAVLNRVSTINYLDEVGTRDGWATKHPTKGSKQLIGSKWGALANKYVPEVVRDYLEAQLDATQMALDTYNNMISSDPNLYTGAMGTKVVKGISGLSGINKMNTVVGNVALWAMAFGGGITSLIANGNFTLKGFKRGTKGVFGGVGTAFRTEFNEVTKELINNKMFDSPTIRDVNAALKKDFVRAALQKEGTVNSKVKALWEGMRTGTLTASEAYAAMDLVYTGSNYFYNKGGLKAHWDKIGKDYTEQELQTEAAAMTRTTNISFAKVPKLVTALERLGGPMMFMGYMMETLRVIPANVAVGGKQIVEGVKTGDVAWTRQGIQRLVGAGVAVTMWQFLAGMLRGSDEDEKEKRKVDALVANHNFVDAPTVVRMFTRDDGTEVYLPLGRFDPFEPSNNIISALAEGRNVSDSVKDLFIQNTLWARAWNAATSDSPEQIRSKVTSYDRQAWDEWVDGSYTKAGLSVFMDTFLPSTARNVSGALTKAERDENYTALQQTSDSLGMRLIEYHPVKSLQDFGRTFDIETDKAWTTLSRKLGANRDISDEEVRSVYAEYLAEERRRVADLTKAVEVAKENGGSVYQIQQYLERGGLSKTAALNMARNPASFTRGLSDRFLAEREKALLENPQNSSPERQRQIKERFRQRRRDMERAIREMRINRNGS